MDGSSSSVSSSQGDTWKGQSIETTCHFCLFLLKAHGGSEMFVFPDYCLHILSINMAAKHLVSVRYWVKCGSPSVPDSKAPEDTEPMDAKSPL